MVQVYRDWLISGDTDWLRKMWPKTRKAIEFAWKYWDADKDGVMEGMQHNTYDIEFYGPNTICGSLYLAALRAAARMAGVLGDERKADEYRNLAEKGSAWTDRHLFNGEYYEQQVRPEAHRAWPKRYRDQAEAHPKEDRFPWPAWQYGKGCMSDQLIGQWMARLFGLGYLYDPKKVRQTLASILKYNWRPDLHGHAGTARIYATQDEAGLVVGTWPRGGRPGYAMYFSDEVWCGMEYDVASLMICEGMLEEGLAVTLAARRRYDGTRRNPWDEIECGHHYARSMSSYALLLALSGFECCAAERRIGFAPRIRPERFRSFFSVASGWGSFSQEIAERNARATVAIAWGSLDLAMITLGAMPEDICEVKATLGGRKVEVELAREGGRIAVAFAQAIKIEPGRKLALRFNRGQAPDQMSRPLISV